MLEKQRLIYLDALGISNYMPRRVLPEALPSQLLPDELLQEPTAFSTADIVDTTLASPISDGAISSIESEYNLDEHRENVSPNSILGILSETESKSVQKDEPIVDVKVEAKPAKSLVDDLASTNVDSGSLSLTSPSAKPTDAIRFTLNIWRINNNVLVVDSRQPGAALPTDKLLQNMLRSMGYYLAQLPSSELLRWPLFSHQQFASETFQKEAAEARAMVQAYISAQCAKVPTTALLLLGQDATNYVLTPDSDDVDGSTFFSQVQGTAVEQPQWQTTALIAPSLIDMLQEPMKKRIAWQALQSFKPLSDQT